MRYTKPIVLASCALLASCATIVDGGPQEVFVDSKPQGADVFIGALDQYAGQTPLLVSLQRGYADIEIRVTHRDQTDSKVLQAEVNPAIFGNILFGGVIGIFVDLASGAAVRYPTHPITFEFKEADVQQ